MKTENALYVWKLLLYFNYALVMILLYVKNVLYEYTRLKEIYWIENQLIYSLICMISYLDAWYVRRWIDTIHMKNNDNIVPSVIGITDDLTI